MSQKDQLSTKSELLAAPQWIWTAANAYRPEDGGDNTQTSFLRGRITMETIRMILPDLPPQPKFLIIGLGLDHESVLCSTQPYRIFSFLQAEKIPGSLTLIDKNPQVVADVRTRTTLYFPSGLYKNIGLQNLCIAWRQYLRENKLKPRRVTRPEPGLSFSPHVFADNGYQSYRPEHFFRSGLWAAPIPPGFTQALTSGRIRIIQTDVANVAHPLPKSDYADCCNVLYLLPPPGQQLALWQLTQALNPGGFLLVTDASINPVFADKGGWLNPKKLADLHLARLDSSHLDHHYALLRKTG